MTDIYKATEKLNEAEKNLKLTAKFYSMVDNTNINVNSKETYKIKAIESAANAQESIENYKHAASIDKLTLSIYQTVKGTSITQNLDKYRDKNEVKKTIINLLKKEEVYDKNEGLMTQFIGYLLNLSSYDISEIPTDTHDYIIKEIIKSTNATSIDNSIKKFKEISDNIKPVTKNSSDKINK